jgi:hypothetical protein
MTNDETCSNTYFIHLVVSNILYSIDILTYPIPTTLPTGFTSSIIFPSVAKNPILKILSSMNDILGYNADFQTNAGSEIQTYNSTKAPNVSPDSSVLIVCDQVQKSIFKFRSSLCYFSFSFNRFFNCRKTFLSNIF